MFYILDWYVVCTGLVCCMYWTGMLDVLDWCFLYAGLVCCMYWTDVWYVMGWCVVCTGHIGLVLDSGGLYIQLVCCMYKPDDLLYVMDLVLCCMEWIGILCEGEGRLWSIVPAPLLKREGWWEVI